MASWATKFEKKKKKKSMKPNSKSTAEQYNNIRNLIK